MKQIGHIDGATTATAWKTHALGMVSPHDLFIPNPGERENVSADQWTHVGWVDPDKDGGRIWTSHAEAGDNSRPAYVRQDVTASVGPLSGTGVPRYGENGGIVQFERGVITTADLIPAYHRSPSDPMDVRRSEFEAHAARLEKLEEICRPDLVARGVLSSGGAVKLAMSKEYGEISRPLPSTIPTGQLLSDALALCNDRLDEHSSSISCESAYADCNAANTMIRELVRRLSEYHEALRPFTAAGAGGHGSALPDNDPLAIISANMPDLPQWIAKARGVVTMGDVRRAMNLFKDEPAPMPVAADQPMTFYDHAFIHAAVNHADYYSGSTMTQDVIDDAHAVASMLTRNRANRT